MYPRSGFRSGRTSTKTTLLETTLLSTPEQKQARKTFAILSLQVSRDMKSIAAGPLSPNGADVHHPRPRGVQKLLPEKFWPDSSFPGVTRNGGRNWEHLGVNSPAILLSKNSGISLANISKNWLQIG